MPHVCPDTSLQADAGMKASLGKGFRREAEAVGSMFREAGAGEKACAI